MDAQALVLIVGGYGTFGGWIARLLANKSRLRLLIAGRSLVKANAFIAEYEQRAEMIAVRFDRDADIAEQIRHLQPDFVIDASGPFQSYGTDPYRVVQAAIACGAHYIDIADDSKFVRGIKALDASAADNKVFALSGASTCVALSSAIYRQLTRHLVRVTSISGGIAPSPRAGVGLGVIQAVAQSAGKRVEAVGKNGTENVYPFTESRSFTIAPPGYTPLRRRRFSIVDVPDLLLVTSVEPKTEKIWFGAAPVPALYHSTLRLFARMVKAGWLKSISFLAPLMFKVMRDFNWGEHRSGMFVEVHGEVQDGKKVTRSWHLVAERDDGPAVPAMGPAAIISNCLNGNYPRAGARPATHELELDNFEIYFRDRDIHMGERDGPVADDWPVFRKVLASAWAELPAEVRQLHDVEDLTRYAGRARVSRGRSPLARLIGRVVGFPPSGEEVAVEVTMSAANGREYWQRNFAGHKFSSIMSEGKGRYANLIREKFGPVHFAMALMLDDGRLNYVPRGWTLFGIPMPTFLAPQGKMCEFVEDDKFHFHVEIKAPIIGHIVTYQGWLQAVDASA